ISVKSEDGRDVLPYVVAGILEHIPDMTVFLNTTEESYLRFGSDKAPKYITWSGENRSQLVRVFVDRCGTKRAELRSPDPLCNPYLAFSLIIRAGLDGIRSGASLPPAAGSPGSTRGDFKLLPKNLEEAKSLAANSTFVARILPKSIIKHYIQ
ncbi:MAG TPA: type I glutamate--ammonia ligase, partial [Bacillota bacterium]|nr:type I glutamate--ammonia ligase [Bacillota bacterium]